MPVPVDSKPIQDLATDSLITVLSNGPRPARAVRNEARHLASPTRRSIVPSEYWKSSLCGTAFAKKAYWTWSLPHASSDNSSPTDPDDQSALHQSAHHAARSSTGDVSIYVSSGNATDSPETGCGDAP